MDQENTQKDRLAQGVVGTSGQSSTEPRFNPSEEWLRKTAAAEDDAGCINVGSAESVLIEALQVQLQAVTKERDEYKFMYEGLCK